MIPRRLKREAGRYALVDGIPFRLPVDSARTQALIAAFPVDAARAQALLPGDELHVARVFRRGVLVITVVNYQETDIGKYIEFSIAIACTHGSRRAPPLLPLLSQRLFGFGQYVFDLPVSTEISVKGGKGIWGMPKHQANLDFQVSETAVSSRYDDEGLLAIDVEINRPRRLRLPLRMRGVNYCQFRGMLMKSYIYFQGRGSLALAGRASARLQIGDHPRVAPLKELRIGSKPLFTAFFAQATGVLDDHFESWFLRYPAAPEHAPEGFESVIGLGLGEDWLPPPGGGR